MRHQLLWGSRITTPEDVLRSLGAIQAQEWPVAKWSLAQRGRGIDDLTVQEAFDSGRILRTHVLRPTWHFVAAEDIRLLLAATARRVQATTAHRYEQLGLDGKQLARSETALLKCLASGRQLTRKEIRDELTRVRIDTEGQRFAWMLMHAELTGVICSGAVTGKQQTYALLEERSPQTTSPDRDQALAELTRRYFTSRGPATARDFGWWSSLTAAEIREGIEMLSGELDSETVDGRTYWSGPSRRTRSPASPIIDLVQIYDEIGIAYTESRDVLLGTVDKGSVWEARLPHMILLDGQAIGHWKSSRKKQSVEIVSTFYRRPTREENAAFDRAIGRYARFLGVPATRARE